jgi:hypothetical protein
MAEREPAGSEKIQELSWGDNVGSTKGPKREQMLFISGNKKVGLSSQSAFQDAIIIVLGLYDANTFGRIDQVRNRTDATDPNLRLLLAKAKLLSQDTIEFGENERRDEKLQFPSPDILDDLIRLTPGEGKSRDQDIGIEDNPHRGGSLAD